MSVEMKGAQVPQLDHQTRMHLAKERMSAIDFVNIVACRHSYRSIDNLGKPISFRYIDSFFVCRKVLVLVMMQGHYERICLTRLHLVYFGKY